MSKLIKCKTCGSEIASHAKVCPSCGGKNKKSIYKKWWFWCLIVLIALGSAGGSNQSSSSANEAEASPAVSTASNASTPFKESPAVSKEPEAPEAIGDGTYKVGTDMPAGEYLVLANMDGLPGYAEISSDSSGNFNSIISNATVMGNIYLNVKDDDYVKLQLVKAYPVSNAPSIIPSDGLYKDGVYKIGSDLPAGEYKVHLSSEMGYVEVASGCRGGLQEIVSNEAVTGDTYVTVKDGQYLKLQGVEIQK